MTITQDIINSQGPASSVSEPGKFNVAESIGDALFQTAVGKFADFGLGAVLANLGLGDTTGDRLDAISKALDQIREQLASLENEVSRGFDIVAFDTATAQIKELVDFNRTMLEQFVFLATSKDPAARAATAKELLQQLSDRKVFTARSAWDDAIRGAIGQTGLLYANGKLLFDKKVAYGPPEAKQMQAYWDWLDGQQALSALFYAEHLVAPRAAEPPPAGAPPAGAQAAIAHLNLWQQNRKKQLTMLRGPAVDNAKVLTLKADGTIGSETVSLSRFPDVVLWKSGNLALYQHIIGPLPIAQVCDPSADNCPLQPPPINELVRQAETSTGLSGWGLMDPALFRTFANENGGEVGVQKGHGDLFRDVFSSLGFTNVTECIWVDRATEVQEFAIPTYRTRGYRYTCYIDRKDWWDPAPFDWPAGVLLVHAMTAADWLKLCWKDRSASE